jgi:hypothetical protein
VHLAHLLDSHDVENLPHFVLLGYFKRRGEAYPDEASEDLCLDFDLVMKITEELKKEGRLKVA